MSEKENRKFHLKIIMVVIVGCSILFGIIFFRRVKSFIRNEENAQEVFEKSFPVKDKSEEKTKTFKGPSQNTKIKLDKSLESIKKELDHRPPQNRHPVTARIARKDVVLIPLENNMKRDLSGKNKRRQREVENIVAVSDKFESQFQKNEIYAKNLGRVFVKKDAANGLESERVAYNTRTGALGVITGKLIIKFQDVESFEKREALLKSYLEQSVEEESAFEASYTGIFILGDLRGDLSMNELERLCQDLLIHSETIKSCKIELLDHAPGAM